MFITKAALVLVCRFKLYQPAVSHNYQIVPLSVSAQRPWLNTLNKELDKLGDNSHFLLVGVKSCERKVGCGLIDTLFVKIKRVHKISPTIFFVARPYVVRLGQG